MFCADSSCWIAYLTDQGGDDVELIDAHLKAELLVMCPVVLAELFSDPLRDAQVKKSLLSIPLLTLLPGFWERSGLTRAELLKHKVKPKLGDTLIAQVCIDHDVALHSRDADFRPFARYAGLQLVLHGLVH